MATAKSIMMVRRRPAFALSYPKRHLFEIATQNSSRCVLRVFCVSASLLIVINVDDAIKMIDLRIPDWPLCVYELTSKKKIVDIMCIWKMYGLGVRSVPW